MAKYAELADAVDPIVAVTESNLAAADIAIDSALVARGIDPADIEGTPALLTQLAAYFALSLAATQQNADGNEALSAKASEYRRLFKEGLGGISRQALGLTTVGIGYGAIPLRRG